jgi:flagellar biosynthetic protein FlhB
MAEESDLERTEAPSERRLEQAREEGQVPRSRELNTFALLGAAGAAMWVSADGLRDSFAGLLKSSLSLSPELATDTGAMMERFSTIAINAGLAIAPVLGLLFAVALIAPLLLSGWLVSSKALTPDFSRLNPIKGFSNMFSLTALAELGKAIGKVLLIIGVAAWVTLGQTEATMGLATEPLPAAIVHGSRILGMCFLTVVGSLALIAAIDVPWQIWHHRSKLKMSREDVRREAKEQEGDPHVKAAIRAQQREMSRRRMMAAVPQADVVVVNPTRYAVALRYDESKMRAPRVVAKGMHLIAGRIRELAEENRVPILQAPPLARALYRHAEVGDEVPAALYAAVAEVLAWVFQLRTYASAGGRMPVAPSGIEVPAELDPEAAAAPSPSSSSSSSTQSESPSIP